MVKSSEGRAKEARGERHKKARRERKRKQGEHNNKQELGKKKVQTAREKQKEEWF